MITFIGISTFEFALFLLDYSWQVQYLVNL